MDNHSAKTLENELRGKSIDDWVVDELIDNGKSAAVFKSHNSTGLEAALKIFDKDLVERFGKEKQLLRISREKKLVGKQHNNLIRIYGGGECKSNGLLYVVMEYVPYQNLYKMNKYIEHEHIYNIISSVASACEFLEQEGVVHRDLKLENIVISDDFSKVIVLDLGVLYPFNLELDYQRDNKFTSTLRCSPPELLIREEEDTPEAWRAITFYQIGAMIYELLAKQDILHEYSEPYAKLVKAVEKVLPKFNEIPGKFPVNLKLLAQKALRKSPQERLKYLNWKDFQEIKSREVSREEVLAAREILTNNGDDDVQEYYKKQLFLKQTSRMVMDLIRGLCVNDTACFPPVGISTLKNTNNSTVFSVSFLNINDKLNLKLVVDSDNSCFDLLSEDYSGFNLFFQGKLDDESLLGDITNILYTHILKSFPG